jgi:hypothetical protein
VINVLWKFIAHFGANFVIALAVMTIGGGKATKVGNCLKVPDEDMVWHFQRPELPDSIISLGGLGSNAKKAKFIFAGRRAHYPNSKIDISSPPRRHRSKRPVRV